MRIDWDKCPSSFFRTISEEDIALVVVGSLEQHAKHLPVGTDVFLGVDVASEAAERAKRRIFILPPVNYGFSAHHMDFPGSVTLRQKTLISLLTDVGEGVFCSGFQNLIFLVSHGGNSASVHTALNELGMRHRDREVIWLRYWDFMKEGIKDLRDSPPGGMGHAGELETSMMMYLHQELVGSERGGYTPATGNEWYHPDMFAVNKITTFQFFQDISRHGNVGTCDTATREKGEKMMACVTQQLARFLDEYPFGKKKERKDDSIK